MTYTFAVSRRSLPVRCLCVLLCLLVLWCFFMTPRAGAVVAEAELAYWGGAIVVSVLAAGGLALASGDAAKIGPAMYTALKDTGGKAWDSIQAIAAWAASAGSKVKDAAFRVGADVWQTITDCFNKSYSDGNFSISSRSWSASSDVSADDCKSIAASLLALLQSHNDVCFNVLSSNQYSHELDDPYTLRFIDDGETIKIYRNGYLGNTLPKNNYCSWETLGRVSRYGPVVELTLRYDSNGSGMEWSFFAPFTLSLMDDVAIPQPDLKYPGDDYLVKAPDLPTVDTDTGVVTWPQDAVWTKDAVAAPYPVGDDGVKVPDIPFDVPVDGTTGKALDDAGSDTDNPSKPGEGEGTETGTTAGLIGSIIELLKNFFDSPSDFRLNLDGFKNLILPDRFPFSIPFDMVKAVKLFAAAAADFVFRIDLDTQYFSVHHTVDLTPYAVPIAFFRYACVFWFAWILISRTHDLIKW